MFRFILFMFFLATMIYIGTLWFQKYLTSTGKAVKREEHEIFDKFDAKINPKKEQPVKTKKKK